ncbi:hypothetical protein IFR05_008401 [Cadophora sp. M221]|nr:hypothetical protein IFR05_008401 [Cadophora sp. M221]
MLPGSLDGRKKKRREQVAAVNPPDLRQKSLSRSSGSSGQLYDGVASQQRYPTRVDDHVVAQSVINMPVNPGLGWSISTQQRSFSMDQAVGFGQNNSNPLANSFLTNCQPSYPSQHTSSIQSDTNQTYFHNPSSPGITDNNNTYRETNFGSLSRTISQSQNRDDYPVMASPRWSVFHENRAREYSAVSPLARSNSDSQHLYEQQDTPLSWYYPSWTELGLRGGSIGTDQWQMRSDRSEAENCSEADISVDKVAGGLSALRVDSSDYRHPTSTTEYAYQDSLLSSSQSSRANSARSTAGTYFSAGDGDQAETSPSTVASNAGSQQWGHSPLAAQYPDGTVARIQEPRRSRSRTTAFQRQVDIWQDGHHSLNAPAQLNNRTMLLDTQCQESNWVSASVIDHLDLGRKTRRLSRPLKFSCTNGGEMTAREAIKLTFRETVGVARTTDFFVASKEVLFEILLGADDIDIFKMLVSNPPEYTRIRTPHDNNMHSHEATAQHLTLASDGGEIGSKILFNIVEVQKTPKATQEIVIPNDYFPQEERRQWIFTSTWQYGEERRAGCILTERAIFPNERELSQSFSEATGAIVAWFGGGLL